MIAKTAYRVKDQTDPALNERVRRQTQQSLAFFQVHPEQIHRRLFLFTRLKPGRALL
jgi:hypothetical protein